MKVVNRKYKLLALISLVLVFLLLAACAQADPVEDVTDEETEHEAEGEDDDRI